MAVKVYRKDNVLVAAQKRIAKTFDAVEKIYVAYSGGKDSTVMLHLVMEEAIKRNQKVAVMYIDFEAQYSETIRHSLEMFEIYKDYIDPHWICVPTLLRNALTNFEPQWIAWDESKKGDWIRQKPKLAKTQADYPFLSGPIEFEEFIVMFAEWYSENKPTAGFIGIRAQESLHRYCAIATWEKRDLMLNEWRWTTQSTKTTWNVYPLYDWRTEDVWKYTAISKDKGYNKIYDKMQMAGVPLVDQRLCQPFGDDQRKGLWLYHILEPDTWFKLVARVNGANSGAVYIQERGNMTGYNKISKPDGHTWKSFCNLLLQTMPKKTREHYVKRFKKFIVGWKRRGYATIPEEAPPELEAACWAPSWRRMCKVLLRNDYWCKGLGQTQPKSEAWQKYKELKKRRAAEKASSTKEAEQARMVKRLIED